MRFACILPEAHRGLLSRRIFGCGQPLQVMGGQMCLRDSPCAYRDSRVYCQKRTEAPFRSAEALTTGELL